MGLMADPDKNDSIDLRGEKSAGQTVNTMAKAVPRPQHADLMHCGDRPVPV